LIALISNAHLMFSFSSASRLASLDI